MVAPQSAGERGFACGQGWVWTPEQSIHVQQCRAVDTIKQTVSLLQAAPRVLLAHTVLLWSHVSKVSLRVSSS